MSINRSLVNKLTDGLQLTDINLSKTKFKVLSKTNRLFVISELSMKRNKIDFAKSVSNLGIVFNGRLLLFNHISAIIGRFYSRLRNLWAVIDSTLFIIRMQLRSRHGLIGSVLSY